MIQLGHVLINSNSNQKVNIAPDWSIPLATLNCDWLKFRACSFFISRENTNVRFSFLRSTFWKTGETRGKEFFHFYEMGWAKSFSFKGLAKIYRVLKPGFGKKLPEKSLRPLFFEKKSIRPPFFQKSIRPLSMVPARIPHWCWPVPYIHFHEFTA